MKLTAKEKRSLHAANFGEQPQSSSPPHTKDTSTKNKGKMAKSLYESIVSKAKSRLADATSTQQ